MKKKLLSLALSVVLALSLLPAQVSFAGNAAKPVNETYNTMEGAESTGSLFHNAYVRNANITASAPNGTAQQLEVVLNTKTIVGTSQIFAVVMSAADYKTLVADVGGPTKVEGGLGNTTYHSLKVADKSRYAMGRADATDTADNQKWAIRLITPDSKNDFDTTVGTTSMGYKAMPKAGVGSSGGSHDYYDEYVLIVFGQGQYQTNEQYYISRFYLDSDGYVRTPSYMLRYNGNVNSTITANTYDGTYSAAGVPGVQIKRGSFNTDDLTAHGQPGDAKLSGDTPTRVGYIFQGWTDQKDFRFLKPDEDAGTTVQAAGGRFWEKGATYTQPDALYEVYDLYAVWKQAPVAFNKTSAADVTLDGQTVQAIHYTTKTPQVGVAFDTGNITLGAPNSANAEPQGWKYFKVEVYERDPETGADVKVGATNYGSASSNANNRVATTKYGLTISPVVTGNKHYQWKISGTPTDHSNGKQVYLKISVMDGANKTEDAIVYWFDEVKKGAQPIPTLDDNTGLQSRVVTSEGDGGGEVKDGQIYGFYSTGPKKGEDTGYQDAIKGTATNMGTGTMTQYYLSKGMVFEYRPVKVGTQEVTWADGDSDKTTTEGYADMPNGGWREMPFPSARYNPADLTKIQAAGEKNGKTLMYSTLANGSANTKAVVTDKTNDTAVAASEAFKTDGWLDSYGWIEFDENGLPVIHGLTENDQYEVRFRANTTYEVSDARVITIGGAVAGGEPSGGSGLAVNLAGGKWKAGQETDGKAFEDAAAALTPGGTLTLPEIEPERDGGSKFLGWTLGERDSEGRLILYRRGTTGTTPEEPKQVTVTWTAAGTTFHTAENVTLDVGKVPESVYPEETPGDIDTETEHKTFDKWGEPAVGEDGNITIAAVYKEKPEITYIWVDPLKDTTDQENPDDKTVGTPFTGYNPPAKEQYPADPVHEGEAPFKEWVMGEPTTHPVLGSELGEGKAQVVITATYKEKVTYVWVDPLKEGEDKTVQTVADAYDVPEHPTETPNHGEDHPFKEWTKGEPVTADGVTTVTFTAIYKEKVTYIWVDPEIKGEEGAEPPSQVVHTKETFDELTEADHPAAPSHAGMDFKGWEVGEPVKGEDGTVTVTITATYGKQVTYIWVDPKKDGEDKTVKGPEAAFEKPEDPEAPVHEGWTFTGWTAGEPETDEETGVTTVTITAAYELEKWTYRDTLPAIDKFPASLAAVWDGGSGGGGLAVNLAGGHWASGDEGAGQAFTADCAALTPGGSIVIPDITPVRETYSFSGWTLGEIDPATNLLVTYKAGDNVKLGSEASSLAAVWNSTTEGVLAVTAYDWDGEMLGTFIFRSDPNPTTQGQNAQQAIAEFVAREDVAAKLAGKPGYDFLTWVKNENNVPTSYGVRVVSSARLNLTELSLNEADEIDFSTLTESTAAKAAYTTNKDTLNDGTGEATPAAQATARNYQTKIVAYGKFGTTANYSITIEVKRGNVPRLTSPWLLVRSVISGVSVYSRYALTGADTETVQVALYAASNANGNLTGVSLVEWTVIDDYGYSNWVNAYSVGARTVVADCRSTASFTIRDVGTSRNQRVWDAGTYPLEGMVAQIYEQLLERDASGATVSTVTAANLRTLGIVPWTTRNADLQDGTYNNWVTLGKPELTYDILNQIGSVASVTP
ncbi:MAG: hypothetical protein HFF09_07795 [Oscillospiraceae bacterium]|nr:hypothetical protein [Oscillospiraceae bacterium]